MSLTADEKKVWTDALRSGDYKQTKGTLHNLDDGGFCCVGVAAKVWGIADEFKMGVYEPDEGYTLNEGPQDVYILLNDKLKSNTFTTLTKMNDRGDTFEEIADWIEEKL